MALVTFRHEGDFKRTERFLSKAKDLQVRGILEKYAQLGVDALAGATPVDSGVTAGSWTYEITGDRSSYAIHWLNTNQNGSFEIAIGLQYGHGTGTGGYVQGRDYINPAMRPTFDKIADEVWKEVAQL